MPRGSKLAVAMVHQANFKNADIRQKTAKQFTTHTKGRDRLKKLCVLGAWYSASTTRAQ